MARIRKAIAAALAAATAATATALQNNGVPGDAQHWAGLIGLALGAALVAGVGVYATPPNAPAKP